MKKLLSVLFALLHRTADEVSYDDGSDGCLYGKEQTLMQIAYAYEKQAGDIIRREPENTPALEDEALAGFLRGLIDRAYSIDYSKCGDKPEGKVQLMLAACEKAAAVDMKDPYATYEAAKELAQAYDSVIEALEG